MTIIYVASPIDQALEPPHPGAILNFNASEAWDKWGYWKGEAVKRLVELDCEVYDPATAWSASLSNPASVQSVNDFALTNADGVLGILPDGTPSIGVPIECAEAAASGTPVVVMGGNAAMSSPVLLSRGVLVVDIGDWKPAVEILVHQVDKAEAEARHTRALGQPYTIAVLEEMVRAAAKFPDNTPTNTPADWFGITIEEYLEVAQAYNDWKRDPTHHGAEAIRMELVQAGAMSARLYDSIRYID